MEGDGPAVLLLRRPRLRRRLFRQRRLGLPKSMLRTRVVAKEQDGDALLCHCFGVTKADFEREPSARDFVVEQTKAGRCSCQTSNPSGRCCLKDFPKPRG